MRRWQDPRCGRELRPYILRRTKDQVQKDLPPVLESKEVLELLPVQRRRYREALRNSRFGGAAEILQLINELRTICDYDPVTGESAKIDRIIELLENIADADEKAVVFSYFLKPLNLLRSGLAAATASVGTLKLTGEMDNATREGQLERFKADSSSTALLASTRVGGEGLTLTEANHVIFINEWWNPSSNLQARDRVVRIGQTRTVQVYSFRCRGTIEETLDRILETKTESTRRIVGLLADKAVATDPDAAHVIAEIKSELAAELEELS